jgi:ligand-binding sensor domain-containing protein
MQMKSYIFFLLLLFTFAPEANAQYTQQDFVLHSNKSGLSDNHIFSLLQDSKGYVWAATEDGLNRFEGNSFKQFHQQGRDVPLLSGYIYNLKAFSKNKIALLTRGGLQVLNTDDYSIQNYLINDTSSFSHYLNATWDAAETNKGNIALSTAAGFYVFKKNGDLFFRKDGFSKKDMGSKRILYARDITPLNNDQLLIDLDFFKYARYDARTNSFTELQSESLPALLTQRNGQPLLVQNRINKNYSFYLYLKTDSIYFLNHKTQKLTASALPVKAEVLFNWSARTCSLNDSSFLITDFNSGCYLLTVNFITGAIFFHNKKLLTNFTITCFLKDKEQRLWIGTKQGVLVQKLKKSFIETFYVSGTEKINASLRISSFYRYHKKLYTGFYSHNYSLAIIDTGILQTKKILSFLPADSNANEVRSIQMYHKDTLWIGTSRGVIWFDTKTERFGKVFGKNYFPEAENISAILFPEDKNGYAWICDYLGGKVIRYHIATRDVKVFNKTSTPPLPFTLVKHVVNDFYGNTWIAGHGLTRLNTQVQNFDTFLNVYTGSRKYDDNIVVISADSAGNLWFYNPYNGLTQYQIKNQKFAKYGIAEGLPSEAFYCFSPIVRNKLWITSNHSLIQFDTETKNSIVFDYNDGLPDAIPTSRYIYYDEAEGYFYTGHNNQAARFKNQMQRSWEQSPVMINELVINGRGYIFHPADEVKLKHNENNITVVFTIIDFENNNYRFYYSLSNDSTWISLSNRRQLDLVNLKAGTHVLRLKTINKAGKESFTKLSIIITPVFWETGWFRLLLVLTIATFIYLLYRYRIRQIGQKSELDKQLLQTEMKALHAQMNPHFIFNCLNSIREMILHNENKEASHYLSRFAQLIRLTLEQSSKNFISLRDTVSYLKLYTEMEQIRNNHFTCRFHLNNIKDEDSIMLPPMLIQPFIENGIWHGPGKTNKPVEIDVSFYEQNNELVCTVADNGIGINQSKKEKSNESFSGHHSIGISNIENRIQLLNEKYKLRCVLTIKDRTKTGAGEGTVVTIYLPMHINSI